MTPKAKFQGYVLTVSTIAIFYLWTWVYQIPATSQLEKLVLGVATSFTSYKIIVGSVLILANKIRLFKRFILGNTYMDGTWVGYYIGPEGKPRYFVESFYQDMEGLTISGRSHNEHHQQHAMWTSVSPTIDPKKGELIYLYDVKAVNDDANNNGISVFCFERDGVNQPPKRLHGFWTDLNIGKRVTTHEKKYSNSHSVNHSSAMRESVKLYEEDKKDTDELLNDQH